jgi:hypothetical protein
MNSSKQKINEYYIHITDENFIQTNLENGLNLIDNNIYSFDISYRDISLYEKSIIEFEKFIMQQVELINGYITPMIYIIFETNFVTKKLKHINTRQWPKITGYIFTDSIIDSKNFYKIYHGMSRYNAKQYPLSSFFPFYWYYY